MKGGAETFHQSTATTGTHRFDSSRQFESKKWPELMSETRNLQTYRGSGQPRRRNTMSQLVEKCCNSPLRQNRNKIDIDSIEETIQMISDIFLQF